MIRLGICNELFEGWPFDRVCRFVKEVGYDGLELAPFTLAPRITDLAPDDRRRLRASMAASGLECIGLHWLLAKTEGFYLTSPDPATRSRTGAYLVELARACHDLGGTVLVLGSPKQRDLLPGVPYPQAFDYAVEVFQAIVGELDKLNVDLLFEPLAPNDTNFINTIPQTLDLVERVGHERFGLHMDIKAQYADPTATLPELIERFAPIAGHFHAQDPNLQGPGMGELDFGPLLKSLVKSGYDRWVSVEVFDYAPGPEATALQSYQCLRQGLDAARRAS